MYLHFIFHVEVVQIELSKDAINQCSYIVLLINMRVYSFNKKRMLKGLLNVSIFNYLLLIKPLKEN